MAIYKWFLYLLWEVARCHVYMSLKQTNSIFLQSISDSFNYYDTHYWLIPSFIVTPTIMYTCHWNMLIGSFFAILQWFCPWLWQTVIPIIVYTCDWNKFIVSFLQFTRDSFIYFDHMQHPLSCIHVIWTS